jgi:hypothetical protein
MLCGNPAAHMAEPDAGEAVPSTWRLSQIAEDVRPSRAPPRPDVARPRADSRMLAFASAATQASGRRAGFYGGDIFLPANP